VGRSGTPRFASRRPACEQTTTTQAARSCRRQLVTEALRKGGMTEISLPVRKRQQRHRRRGTAASARRCRSPPGPGPAPAARPPSASVAPSGEAAASLRRPRTCPGSRRGAGQAAVVARLDDRARRSNSQRIRHRALLLPPISATPGEPRPSLRESCGSHPQRHRFSAPSTLSLPRPRPLAATRSADNTAQPRSRAPWPNQSLDAWRREVESDRPE